MALPLTYHWRNLFVRKGTTLLTVLVVMAVVGMLGWILGFRAALRSTLRVAHDDRTLIVLRRGATSETNSAIPEEEYKRLAQLTTVARDERSGEPLLSPEMVVQVSLPRVRDGGQTAANVAVRGVTDLAFPVHSSLKLQGPGFSKGDQEVIVGVAAAKQFKGLALGDTLNLGFGNNRGYKVVGYFTADGGPLESEIWGYLPSLMSAYNRRGYSSVNVRLADDTRPLEVIEQIRGPAIQLDAQTEESYWDAQSSRIRVYMAIVGALVGIMALAAVFSIANTMFSSVAGRTREIAMLRTIGFSGRQVLVGFVVEAVMLSLLGGLAGCLACAAWLELVGSTKDMFGATTFTTLAFEIRLTPLIVIEILLVVTVVGALGAFFPACRAARTQVITTLREP